MSGATLSPGWGKADMFFVEACERSKRYRLEGTTTESRTSKGVKPGSTYAVYYRTQDLLEAGYEIYYSAGGGDRSDGIPSCYIIRGIGGGIAPEFAYAIYPCHKGTGELYLDKETGRAVTIWERRTNLTLPLQAMQTAARWDLESREEDPVKRDAAIAVSYTHLTLPTNREV